MYRYYLNIRQGKTLFVEDPEGAVFPNLADARSEGFVRRETWPRRPSRTTSPKGVSSRFQT